MKRKKAQAPGAAGLIAIVGVIILLYILFIPPAERERLLGDNDTKESDEISDELGNLTILLRNPGSLDYLKLNGYEHSLQGFSLYSSTEAEILEQIDSLVVRRNLFSKEFKTITFKVPEVEYTENILLSFSAPERRGNLIVYLNGNLVADRTIKNENPTPISLPDKYIKDMNEIEFQVSGPGALFWVTNKFNLQNIKITADITDVSGLESRQFFYVTEKEKENLESVKLKFIADCKISSVGPLDIYLNNENIYSSIPDCGMLNTINIDPKKILEGENKIIVRSQKGTYSIYSMEVETELKDLIYPTYYFEITDEQFRKIENDTVDVNLTLLFGNDVDLKDLTLKVNNHAFEVYTRELKYDRLIDSYVRKGNNVLEFDKLRTKVDIVELKIKLIEK
jgi:hypothetical protein